MTLFFSTRKKSLGGQTPLEALAAGRIQKVMDVAAAYAELSQTDTKLAAELVETAATSRVLRELVDTARDLHRRELLPSADLSYLILLANTRPTSTEALQATFLKRYPNSRIALAMKALQRRTEDDAGQSKE